MAVEQKEILKSMDVGQNKFLSDQIAFVNENSIDWRTPFIYACENGYIDIAKYLAEHYFKYHFTSTVTWYAFTKPMDELTQAFNQAVDKDKGGSEVIEWLWDSCGFKNQFLIPGKNQKMFFNLAITQNNFKHAKLMWQTNLEHNLGLVVDHDLFSYVCGISCHVYGPSCRNMAMWLLEIDPTIDIQKRMLEAFALACGQNNVDLVKWILSFGTIIDINYNNTFLRCCETGSLELAKLLYEIKNDNIPDLSDGYILSKVEGIAKLNWFVEICPDIKFSGDIFAELCGKTSAVEWYIETSKKLGYHIDFPSWAQEALKNACAGDLIDNAKFLINLYPNIDIRYDNDAVIKAAADFGCSNIVDWIHSLNKNIPIPPIKINNEF